MCVVHDQVLKFFKIFATNVRFPKFLGFPLNGRLVASIRDGQIYGMYVTLKEGSYPMSKFCENKVNFLKKMSKILLNSKF